MIHYWDDALKYIRRRRIAHSVACWSFVVAIAVLYLTNFVMGAFVYQDSLLELFQNFICPVVIDATIYAIDWKHCYTTKFICDQLPAVPMTVFAAPAIAAFLACIFHDPQRDTIDFSITLLASLSMATAPYVLRNVQRACCVIVAEAIGFILLAARLGYNSAAIVSIFVVATMLILALPKLDWYLPDESHIKRKTQLALPEVIQQHKLLEKLSMELPELHTSVKRIAEQYAHIEREGDSILRFLFAKLLTDGAHPTPNPRRSLELYLKAAQQGLSAACRAVSHCYRNGLGTPADPVAAELWERKGIAYRKVEDANPETRLAVHILNRHLDNPNSYC